jgi:hypothetical protein
MKIKFSRHAGRQMKWREITERDVGEVINNPEKLEDTLKGRKNAFKKIEDRLLKVTYLQENSGIIVITAIVKGE